MSKRKPNYQQNRRKNPSAAGHPVLYGQHAVRAALSNPKRQLIRLYASQNAARDLEADMPDFQNRLNLQMKIVEHDKLNALVAADAVHQGLVLETEALTPLTLDGLIARGGLIIVLDQVSDPRNVGAILRAAAVFGASGIVMTRHNSPPAMGSLAKTASGALEIIPMVEVTNLARALRELQKAGYLTVGLDETGTDLIDEVSRDGPLACVMGAEGSGLRRLTRETCDVLARLPAASRDDGTAFATLNVATAAAVTLYALTR